MFCYCGTIHEWIEIRNDSKKKINLQNWTIATGWDKLINHKITKKFVLKAKESKKLTSKFCAFTLNNAKNKIELRDPTGETVQKIKYNRKKDKIEDDEIFAISGKKWEWDKLENLETKSPIGDLVSKEETPPLPSGKPACRQAGMSDCGTGEGSTENTGGIIIIPESEIEAGIGKSTPDISWQNRKDGRIQLVGYGTGINTPAILANHPPMVAGASIEKISPKEKHWAVSLFDNSIRKINFGLNWILRKL